MPTPPPAPLMSTRWPAVTSPASRIPRRAVVAAMGTAAACSKVRPAGLGTTRSAAAHAYSANAPRQNPSTSSPVRSPRTFALAAPATPAASTPATRAFGLVSPTPMGGATSGSPPQDVPVGRVKRSGVHPDQHVVSPDLWQVSVRQPQDCGPNLSWTIAFTGSCLLSSRRVVVIDTRPPAAGRCASMTGEQHGRQNAVRLRRAGVIEVMSNSSSRRFP